MPNVFISYRRSDSQDVTGRIYDRLLARYTQTQVFKDVDSIPMGVSFPAHIKQMLSKAGMVLVIIGPNWAHVKDEQGRRRLDDPKDYVRLEIEIALRANMPVIPVLVSNARMPSESDLPPSVQPLVLRNGMAVRPDPDFNNDMMRLLSELDRLEKLLNPRPDKQVPAQAPSRKSGSVEGGAVVRAAQAPDPRPAAIEGSIPVVRAKKRAAAGPAPAAARQRSKPWFVLGLAGLLLLLAGAVGLWSSGVLRPNGSASDYDLTGGDRFVHFGVGGPRVVLRSNDAKQKQYFAQVYDLAAGKAVSPPLKHDGIVRDAVFSPNGKQLVTICGDSVISETARVWDAVTGEAICPPFKLWDAPPKPTDPLEEALYNLQQSLLALLHGHAAFSPDGKKVVTSLSEARVWDAATGKKLTAPLKVGSSMTPTFSLDGKRILTANDKSAQVWDAVTGKEVGLPLKHEDSHEDSVRYATFSPDGKRIVTTSSDKTARVWDAATGREVGLPLKHQDDVWYAAFSPDGKRVVTASKDKTARVWDATTGKALTPPLQHNDQVEYAIFSLDGTRVVTSSQDKTARLWDAATGRSAAPPLTHDDAVRRAAFSPDGKQVVTRCYNGTVRLWDAQTGQELKKTELAR